MVPEKYDEIVSLMQNHVFSVTYDAKIEKPSIAYTYTVQSPSLGRIEQIYVNDSDEELAKFLFMHECGHILYGHTRPMQERIDSYLLEKLKGAYAKLKDYFGNYSGTFFKYFQSYFLNIVMDMEVNSRLFSQEEWNFFADKIQKMLKTSDQCGIWPSYYDLPLGLTWNEYLTIFLMEPELYFDKLRLLNILQEAKKQKVSQAFDGALTESDYFRIKNLAKNKKLTEKEIEQIKEKSQEHGNAEFGIPTGSMDCSTRNHAKPCTVKFTKYVSMPDLVEKMKKLLFTTSENLSLRNQMYNSNRRKYNSSVIIPKNVKAVRRNEKPDLYLLFDVSGSIDAKSVHDFIKTFEKFQKEFVNTTIIFWTTKLVHISKLGDKLPNLYGGGTDMASGIKYCKENFNIKPKDTFFLISDFFDYLKDWKTELEGLKCSKYAIDWATSPLEMNPGFKIILKNDGPVGKRKCL